MEEPDALAPKNEPEKVESPPPRKPSIRTMESDMENLFKNTKPPLIQMMGKDIAMKMRAESRHSQSSFFKKFLIVFLLMVIIAGGGAFLFIQQNTTIPPSAPPPPAVVPPSPLFSVEDTTTVLGSFTNRALLLQRIGDAIQENNREGTFTHIPVEIAENTVKHWATFDDIIALYRFGPSPELIIASEGQAMLFSYHSSGGTHAGIAFRVRDLNRALRGALDWESSLLKDMTPLFFDEPIEPTVAPFESRTFRNIDWRFLSLSKEKDFGIAYMIFPAEQLFVLTTSQEGIETIISRLYGQ